MTPFEALSPQVVEEGQAHPFVEALVKELRREVHDLGVSIRNTMASPGGGVDHCRVMAGRSKALEEVLFRIDHARGKEED